MSGTTISSMTARGSLPASLAYVPVVVDGDTTNYRYDIGAALASGVSLSALLVAISGAGSSANKVAYYTGSDTVALADFTVTGRAVVACASASAVRTAIGAVIGTDVQAYNANLSAIAGLTSAADKLPYFTGSGTAALADFTAAGRALVDDASASAQRTTLGLGTSAVIDTGTSGTKVPLLDGANTWSAAQTVPDDAYDATSWNGNNTVPTKNAVRDKIEALGGPSSTTPTVRSIALTTPTSASSFAVSFPSGAAADDLCVIAWGGGFSMTTPTGWTCADFQAGTNWNGGVFIKRLTSGDVSTGSVTISAAGSFNATFGVWAIQTGTWIRVVAPTSSVRTSSNATTQVVWSQTPSSTDRVLYFSSARGSLTCTFSAGVSNTSANAGANSSGIMGQNSSAPGELGVTETATYSGTPSTGTYTAAIVVR
jgi:hypothetical protein